jgi:hypothetical protein
MKRQKNLPKFTFLSQKSFKKKLEARYFDRGFRLLYEINRKPLSKYLASNFF